MNGKATLTFAGINLGEVESLTLKSFGVPASIAGESTYSSVRTGPVEVECAFTWSDGWRVKVDLLHTINFNECDKQAIANPWYSGWRTR